MQRIFNKITTKSEAFNRRRISYFNAAVFDLEQAYLRVLTPGRTSIVDAIRVAYLVLKIHVYTVETYFITFGIWILAFSSSTFLVHPLHDNVEHFNPSVLAIALVTTIPLVMAFVTVPIQIIYKIRMSIMTLAHAVLSALAVSLIQPLLFSAIFGGDSLAFTKLFVMMLLMYLLTNFYMMLILKDTICIVYFGQRQLANGFIDFIPPHKRGDLIALSSQDHYVEFFTNKGSHLHRISMKDAVSLIPESSGMQVHRCHWVAYAAMHKLETMAGRHVLTLSSNAVIPVSKAKLGSVKAALESR